MCLHFLDSFGELHHLCTVSTPSSSSVTVKSDNSPTSLRSEVDIMSSPQMPFLLHPYPLFQLFYSLPLILLVLILLLPPQCHHHQCYFYYVNRGRGLGNLSHDSIWHMPINSPTLHSRHFGHA